MVAAVVECAALMVCVIRQEAALYLVEQIGACGCAGGRLTVWLGLQRRGFRRVTEFGGRVGKDECILL